jgi:hypothetical protein
MKIEIRNRWSNEVIYTHEAEGATMRDAVLAAVRQGADLRDANLRDADLRDANLRDANLRGTDLRDADLRGTDLSGADLRGTDLRGTDLSGASLSDADLRDADLRGTNLRDADLRDANLRDADLRGTNLRDADLTPIRDDIWAVLSSAPREVPAVIEALKAGRVDGSTYHGPCACLVGTIAIKREVGVDDLEGLCPNSSRPAERFFMGIRSGDTPETNQFSALALEWVQQWHDNMVAAFGPKSV